jgi:putative transposase
MGISTATFYSWKKQYAGVGVSELRELRQLREENGKLKRLVADLALDRHILQEVLAKSYKASPPPGSRAMDTGDVSVKRAPGSEAG